MADDQAPRVRSVDRAVTLLYVLAEHDRARVTDLAGHLGIHKSTASRLLATLERGGMVARDDGGYRLGRGILRLAGAVDPGFDLGSVSRPICTELAASSGETVNVVILDDMHTMCIDQVIGGAAVTTVNWVGKRAPLHSSASGKVFLAHQPGLLDRVLANSPEAATTATVTDPRGLRDDVQAARARGWTTSIDEQEDGLTSVAAPILGPGGNVVAALAVSAPSFRLADPRLEEVGAATADAARRVSRRTGHIRAELADR